MTERNADVSKTLTEKWINIYKHKNSYWCGTPNHTKSEALLHLADTENYLTTVNIEQLLKLQEQNTKLKELVCEFAEANQSLRKQLDEEKAKNRIDYYNGSPMDFLDECERDRKKNKIYKNWIKNINTELLTSELRKTKEGNLFIVNLLKKIDQVLGEE